MQISNIHESIIVMKSIDTRFIRNVFEAVQKIRMLNYTLSTLERLIEAVSKTTNQRNKTELQVD